MNLEVFRGKTLLIVDDEPDLREPLVTEFESLGCRVFQASNGRAAFEIVKKEKVDAVISDIRMPGGDGVELLNNIKDYHHEFPMVLLITGFSDLSREEAYHIGAEAVLAKPFDLDEIDRAVSRILTPPSSRWTCQTEPSKIKKTIEARFASQEISLGRGGVFIQKSEDHPFPGQHVALNISFSNGDILLLEGTGIVRWVRREESEGLPQGCGIEFDCLNSETREKILELTSRLKLKPFIPRA